MKTYDQPLLEPVDLVVIADGMNSRTRRLVFGSAPTISRMRLDDVEYLHRTFPGNRPSNTLLVSALTPRTLGQLVFCSLAAYAFATIPFREGIRRTLAWFEADPARQEVDAAMDATMDDLVERFRVR